MTDPFVYRALFPPHYNPRRDGDNSENDRRTWFALRLPFIRVMGPMWSFGLKVQKLQDVEGLPGLSGKTAVARSMRTLFQEAATHKHGAMEKFHEPVLLHADVESFLPVQHEPAHESRLSLLAVDTIPSNHVSDGELKIVDPDDLPVVDGRGMVGGPMSIIVSPFGDPPAPITKALADYPQYLPAMQLMHGLIRFKPRPTYLNRVRQQLGLDPLSGGADPDMPNADTIVLLPDGFCVTGTISLPWRTTPVRGWFKATFRRYNTTDVIKPFAGQALDAKRVLTPWFDPDSNGGLETDWRGYLNAFERILRESDEKKDGPKWLQVAPSTDIQPMHLFWPESEASHAGGTSPLFKRPASAVDEVNIDSAGLVARLSDRPQATGPLATLTIQPASFVVRREQTDENPEIVITGKAGHSSTASGVDAIYQFSPPGKEGLSFAVAGKRDAPITLAVPLIETAEAVRRACGLELPEPGPLGLLWAFTPLNDGWLHWPLPNATAATLSIAVDNSAQPPPTALRPAAPDDVNGALMFGNRMTSFATSNQRPWSFGVTDVLGADLSITFDASKANFGAVKSARIVMSDVMLSLESFASVTAFRQSAERILPDHAERALNTFGLRAFSPESLRGIERRMWDQASVKKAKSKVRMEAILSGFRIDNSATYGARPADGAQVALKTMLGGRVAGAEPWSNDMRPWIWSHHDMLPTVQTLPLAVAGKSRNAPSGLRALAPLRLQDPPTNGELVYSSPLDLGAGAMDISVRYTELIDGKPKSAQFERPNAGEAWRDEVGMSVTTLPSVTLFAGLKPRSAEVYSSTSWSGLSTTVRGEWRHDLALRDEHHAFVRTPAAPPKLAGAPAEPAPPDVTFTPLPNNGPVYRHSVKEKIIESSNGWERVWRFVNRKAALAALDGRAMFERHTEGIRLVGVFGDSDFKIKSVGLATQTVLSLTPPLDAEQKLQQEVRSIGQYVFEPFDSATKDAKKEFPGLPAEDDLTGLSGLFVRSGTAVKVTYGTAALRREGGSFIDQHGLRLGATTTHAAVTVKQLASPSQGLKTVRLVSLNAPIPIANGNGPKLAFWCVDVPVAEKKYDVLGVFCATGDLEGRVNAAGRASNHLAGFRWELISDGTPDRLVIVQGMVFEPRELVGFDQTGSERPSEIRIRGRIRMPVSVDEGILPMAEGVAILTLTIPSGDGKAYEAKLTSEGGKTPDDKPTPDHLVLPLANPESFSGVVPTLMLKLPELDAIGPAVLRYRLDEQDVTVEVIVKRGSDGTISMPNPLKGGVTAGKDPGAIDFSALTLNLAGAVVKEINGEKCIVLEKPHSAIVSYDIQLGTAGAAIAGKARVDLISRAITTEGLKFRFSTVDEIKIEPLEDTGLIIRSGALALCWAQKAGTTRFLDGLSVTAAAGSALAALAQPIANGKVPPSYRVTDLDLRARFRLETFAPSREGTIAATQLLLTLDRVSEDRTQAYAMQIGYRMAGRIPVRNAFSWPRLTVAEAPHHWLTATASMAAGERFVHSAEVIFEGQGIAPGDLTKGSALTLAAEVHHEISVVSPTGQPVAGDKSRVTWRTYQVIRLFSMAALQTHLSAIATPVSGKIEKAETALSPLMDKTATPLIDEKAAPHFHHIGSANPGTLSRKLAAQLLQHLGANPQPALMVDFSNHALLAFDASNAGAAKLGVKLQLLGLPGVAFLGATENTAVVPNTGPIAAAFASKPATETALHLSATDGYASLVFPALEPRLAERVRDRVGNLAALRQSQEVDLPTLLMGFDRATASQPVFQPVVFQSIAGGKATMAADDLPAVGSAFHLSQLFDALTDPNPLAIGFGGQGRLTAGGFFTEDLDDPKHPLKKQTVFDPTVYRRAIALFRNWAEQSVVPGPDILPSTPAADPLTRVVTLQVDGLSRDGQRVETIGRHSIVLPKDQSLPTREQVIGWAKRTLQRVAPWAPRGLVTLRTVTFGLDDSSRVYPVEVTNTAPTRVQKTVRLTDRALPQQAQREQAQPMDAPSADIMPGYLPLEVAPALFQSDGEPLPAGTTDGPRLTATGVVMSWTMAKGTHAQLASAGPGSGDDFWITDRETVAFRPFKMPPTQPTGDQYELTFALPKRYTAALPQALAPAAHGNPPTKDGTTHSQAFAPAYVGTSRISARAGAWTATRTGLIHARGTTSLRASETPVHVRQPRPPLLAVNDRPRASSHEEAHVAVGTLQTVLVHGPRATRIGSDPEPTGLNRAPRSLWATKLALAAPEKSVLSREWDGVIQLDVVGVFGNLPDAGWEIAGAALLAEGVRYEALVLPSSIQQKTSSTLRFEDFRVYKLAGGTSARSAIRAISGATEVTFELNLEFAQTGGSDMDVVLNRQVQFRLLTAGAALSNIERPVFFRFDDPEFNDMLGGLAKLSRKPSAPWPDDDLAFAADSSEIVPEQRLELALALRPSVPGATIKTPFVSKALGPGGEAILTYDEGGHAKPLRLFLERLRKDDYGGRPRPLAGPIDAVSNTVAAGDIEKGYFLKAAANVFTTTFHAMRIDCARLLSPTSHESMALQPGDQFRLDLVAGQDTELVDVDGKRKAPLISLFVDVVKAPNLPANPAAFAVLAMLNAELDNSITVNTQLYANGPDAAVIEIVDPRDLIEGLVRRRATYLWRSFHASRLEIHFALQKINGVGATWLPKSLAQGWQKAD